MTSPSRTIHKPEDIQSAFQWAFSAINKGLESGPVVLSLGREGRTLSQNAKAFAMYNDIAKQVEWYGSMLEPEDWKDLLSAAFEQQRLLPGISGGFVAIGARTSKYNKAEFSDFIESIIAFGADRGVKFSDESMAFYESISSSVK